MRRLCATVLVFEVVVIWLAIPVAISVEGAPARPALVAGGALAVAAASLAAVVARPGLGWTLVAGSVLQLCMIAAGVVVPAMYFLGILFAALWATGILLARHHERSPLR